MEERNSNLNLEKSRNGLDIPLINGVYLHSIYNPTKEAEDFVEKNESTIKNKSTFLILGLGFGYHIEALVKSLRTHNVDYKILVLEANIELLKTFEETRPFEDSNIEIQHLSGPISLYSEQKFVNFLQTKPAVLKHEASFTINQQEYTDFLKFKASESKDVYEQSLTDQSKKLLNLYQRDHIEAEQEIRKTGSLNGTSDYLVMAFNHLKKLGN